MQSQIEKVNIILLPTLFLKKTLIVRIIDVLKNYLNRQRIKNIVIINKLLIFTKDFLNVCNITRAIY